MFKPRTYLEVVMAMQSRAVVTIGNATGTVNGVQPEDGSGRCWNVTIYEGLNKSTTVFFREGAV